MPLILALLGAVLGQASTVGAQPSANAVLVLQLEGADAATLARKAQAALLQASTDDVFERAAQQLKMSPVDLRRATTLTASNESFDIDVKVRADNPERAAQMANAVADAAVAAGQADVRAQLKDLEDTTAELIQSKASSDAAAERSRVTRLGEGLADNQSRIVALSNRLRLQTPARPDAVTSSSRNAAMMSGVAGGLLLGLFLVLSIGMRRGRVHSEGEVARLYPEATVTTSAELQELSQDEEWAVLHIVVASDSDACRARAADLLSRELAIPQRVDITACRPKGPAFRRAVRDPETAVLFPVTLRKTRIQDLDQQTRNAPAGLGLLVMEESSSDDSQRAHDPAPAVS